tara:strand:+ start:325 stop:609 length:285 start_codon:yes stop_codon:yes gene_type:complete
MRTVVLLPSHSKGELKQMFRDTVESPEESHTIDGTAIQTLPAATIISLFKAYQKTKIALSRKKEIIIKTSNSLWAKTIEKLLPRHGNIRVECVS